MKKYIEETMAELELLDNIILNKTELEDLPHLKELISTVFNAYKDFIKQKLEGVEKLQRCDCCGKLKSGKFICGTCEDCI